MKMPASLYVAPSMTGKSFTCATIQLLGSARYFHEAVSLGQMLQVAEMKEDELEAFSLAISEHLVAQEKLSIADLAAWLIATYSIVPKVVESTIKPVGAGVLQA